MPAVKALERVVRKFVDRASVAGPDYSAGVQSPRRQWQEASVAAEDIYKAEVVKAANEGRRARGIAAAGNAFWQARTLKLGPNRFAEGVAEGAPRYQQRFGQVRAAVEAFTLPAGGAKGSAQQAARMTAMRDRLIQIGREIRGGTAR